MATIVVSGRITKTGKLKVELPPGLPPGEVRVTIEYRDPSITLSPALLEEIKRKEQSYKE